MRKLQASTVQNQAVSDSTVESGSNKHVRLSFKQKMRIRMRLALRQRISIVVVLAAIVILLSLSIIIPQGILDRGEVVSTSRPPDSILTMDFVGDIMLGRYIKEIGDREGYSSFFQNVSGVFKESNLVFGNLESTVLKENEEYMGSKKSLHLSTGYEAIEAMRDAGVNVFSCANNHSYDYGEKPLSELIAYFNEKQVVYNGIGNTSHEAAQVTYIQSGELTVGFIAATDVFYSASVLNESAPSVLSTAGDTQNVLVAEASKKADIVIVYIHFGEENEVEKNDNQIAVAHRLIDAGADIVIGSHPNVLQSVEKYKEGIIFYSLGNFVFDQGNTYSKDSVLVEYTMGNSGDGMFEIVPLRINSGIPSETAGKVFQTRITREITQDLQKTDYYITENGHVMIPFTVKERNL